MKHTLYFLLSFCITAPAFGQREVNVKPNLSPFTKLYLADNAGTSAGNYRYVYKTDKAGQSYVSALLKVNIANTQDTEADLERLGVRVGTKAGVVWTAQVPLNKVKLLTELSSISYVQLDEPIAASLDEARKTTRTDSVHAGIGLQYPFSGDGIVVGIIDAGFDYTHPVFFDTTGTNYRVKKVWEQRTAGTPPNGYAYGNELTNPNDIWAKAEDGAGSHGTHVGGIAGGAGFGSGDNGRQYRGMAFQSDLVFVSITPAKSQWANTGASDILDGIRYIYGYASTVNKPAVANLSWGGPVGPRDGSSLFSIACDNMATQGRAFVCSGGNNGERKMHIRKSFTATDTVVNTFIDIPTTPIGKITWLDVWGQNGKSFCGKVKLYGRGKFIDSTALICLDGQVYSDFLIGSNADTCFVDFMTSAMEFNGKPRLMMEFRSKVADSICISVSSNDGMVDMWTGFVHNTIGYYGALNSNGFAWATDGNTEMTISDIASTKTAVAVGAYSTRLSFRNINGITISFGGGPRGNLASFSSRGPASDGSVKPDITGPGLALGSAVNSYDPEFQIGGGSRDVVAREFSFPQFSRSYPFALLAGTSMSSPAVAGIIALMLQANPKMNSQQIKSILNATAIKDSYTGTIPAGGNNNWGNGKVNAYGAVKQAWQTNNVADVNANAISYKLYPNPTTGAITLSYEALKTETATVNVYDLTGKKLRTDLWKLTTGNNTRTLDMEHLGKGFYMVELQTTAGKATSKVVVE